MYKLNGRRKTYSNSANIRKGDHECEPSCLADLQVTISHTVLPANFFFHIQDASISLLCYLYMWIPSPTAHYGHWILMWIAGTHAMELPVNRPHQGDGYPTLDKKNLQE